MINQHEIPCPCTSGNSYKMCCRRFHEGVIPDNALELMRSRFSAYALDLADYIIATTHPASHEYSDNKFAWKRAISKFSKSSHFHQLTILDFKENKTLATVTFVANITQGDHDSTFTEKSFFEKLHGRWLYKGGLLEEGHSPNLVTVGQLRMLPLAYYGEPVLRRNGDPVSEVTEEIKSFVEGMIETMDAADGIGLAAPQVHHSIRLFIIRMPIETGDEKTEFGGVEVFINPVILSESQETWIRSEGCLSIPSIREEVERPSQIVIEYTTLEGDRVTRTFSGLAARIIQHENDHINGILFIDRLKPEIKEKVEPLLVLLQNRFKDPTVIL